MNSVQINWFIAAAKFRSFSKAAASLYLSQPTFSRNISALEEELGISLFSRNAFHGIEVTPAGKLLLEAFTRARKEVLTALETAQKLEQEAQLHMTVGLLLGQLLDERLEDLLTRFRIEFPNSTVNLRRTTCQELMGALYPNEIDVIYMPQWQYAQQEGLSILCIGEMETILVAPKRLAPEVEDRVYSLAEFQNHSFIPLSDSESRGNRAMLAALFDSLHMKAPVYVAQSIREQIEKVEMGEGL